jgi:hypothetical protein
MRDDGFASAMLRDTAALIREGFRADGRRIADSQ